MSLYGSPFFKRNRILWGVVPSALQEAILAELHDYATHEGLVARNERRHRDNRLVMCRMPNGTRRCTFAPLELASTPLDYAGPINGRMYLVLIDAHSSTPSSKELRPLFAKFGLPDGICHAPASNGLAERAVQIVKRPDLSSFCSLYRLAPLECHTHNNHED